MQDSSLGLEIDVSTSGSVEPLRGVFEAHLEHVYTIKARRHGSTPSEAGAGVFILADTPKIAKFKTGVENYGSVSMGRYQGSVSRGLPPMGHS